MNIVDTANGPRDVTQPGWQRATKAVTALVEGDVIAVPFEDFDILCAITEVDHRPDATLVAASDGQFTYLHELQPATRVRVYPADQKGQVQS